MNSTLKLTYIIFYILFLLAVIMLFAVASNTVAGSASFYIFIFAVLILGTALFSLAIINTRVTTNESKRVGHAETETAQNLGIINTTEETIQEVENEIDIQKLLPAKPTEMNRFAEEVLHNMADEFNIMQALFYIKSPAKDSFSCNAQYAYFSETKPKNFKTGETLPGQAVKNKTIVVLNNIPDNYMTIVSGLGKSKPRQLVFVPLKNQDEVVGLIEYATFEPITKKHQKALDEISKKVADTIVKLLKK
jgi:transcriptional regulator with GAF, ATPase, and Fis domain